MTTQGATATTLAFERTRAAFERTLQAWIRTATSLITFGFSVYKFFQIENPRRADYTLGPREFGVALVSIGFLSLIFATIEHNGQMRSLRKEYPEMQRASLSQIVAGALSLVAIFALMLMLLRQ